MCFTVISNSFHLELTAVGTGNLGMSSSILKFQQSWYLSLGSQNWWESRDEFSTEVLHSVGKYSHRPHLTTLPASAMLDIGEHFILQIAKVMA